MLDYEPISRCRDDLATFSVADMQVSGEFNFVYCNERVAREKINLLFHFKNGSEVEARL